MIGSLIAGGASILGNYIGARQNRRNVRDTNKANFDMAEYSYDKNLEQWKRQNEYNSPVNQMSRFKQAGLNPNMIYGQGSPGNATGSPQHSPAKQDYSGRQNPMAMSLVDIAQARLLNAQAKATEKQADLTDTTNIGQKIANDIAEATKGAKTQQARAEATTSEFRSLITNIEHTQKFYGIENASEMYKIIFQNMNNNTLMTQDQMHKALMGITITSALSKALAGAGLGWLLKGNKSKKR